MLQEFAENNVTVAKAAIANEARIPFIVVTVLSPFRHPES
jgi:cold shock protein